jgi:hypothetical protein
MSGLGRKMQRDRDRGERRDAIAVKRKIERGNAKLTDTHRAQLAAIFAEGQAPRPLSDFQKELYRRFRAEGWSAEQSFATARSAVQLPGHTQIPPRVPDRLRPRGFDRGRRGSARARPRPAPAPARYELTQPPIVMAAPEWLREPIARSRPLRSVQMDGAHLKLKKEG